MKRWIALAVVLVVGLAGAGCSRQSSKAAGRLNVDGQALVTANDGGQKTVTEPRTLRSGEQVRVVEGTATLGLGQGGQLELRKDSTVRLVVESGPSGQKQTRGELATGDVLVTTSEGTAEVAAGDTVVRVSGAARVTRGLAVVVAAYQGSSSVESVSKRVDVRAPRQTTVPAPGVVNPPGPVPFSASDPWDQRYLADAIELGNQLEARGRGFTAQLVAGQDTGEAFFRQILPSLRDQPFDGAFLAGSRSAGETLIGAAITLEGTNGDFRERWVNAFGFHAQGAPWGLVALDQAVARQPLLAAVDAATGRLPSLGPQATTPAPTTGTVPIPVPVPTTAPPAGSQTAAPATGSSSSPPTTVSASNGSTQASPSSPASTPGSDTVNLGIPLVDNTVNAVVDLLNGVLKSIGGGP
ncbi:MAG: hypothetical protein ACRD12_06580 [Acidimicrobiales bacterium]